MDSGSLEFGIGFRSSISLPSVIQQVGIKGLGGALGVGWIGR